MSSLPTPTSIGSTTTGNKRKDGQNEINQNENDRNPKDQNEGNQDGDDQSGDQFIEIPAGNNTGGPAGEPPLPPPHTADGSRWLADLKFGLGQLRLCPKLTVKDGEIIRIPHVDKELYPDKALGGMGPSMISTLMDGVRHLRDKYRRRRRADVRCVEPPRKDFMFIVLGEGKPGNWRLHPVEFPLDADGQLIIRDTPTHSFVIRKMCATIEEKLGKKWLRQYIFPTRVGRVECREFQLFNNDPPVVTLPKCDLLRFPAGGILANDWFFTGEMEKD